MKPFLVEYTVKAVVMAEDEDHAWAVARSECRDVFYEAGSPEIWVEHEVEKAEDLLGSGWDLGCIPYGGDGNTRISELMTSAAKQEGEQ